MKDNASDRLLVVGEGGHRLTSGQIPHPDGGVIASSNDLWIGRLEKQMHQIQTETIF